MNADIEIIYKHQYSIRMYYVQFSLINNEYVCKLYILRLHVTDKITSIREICQKAVCCMCMKNFWHFMSNIRTCIYLKSDLNLCTKLCYLCCLCRLHMGFVLGICAIVVGVIFLHLLRNTVDSMCQESKCQMWKSWAVWHFMFSLFLSFLSIF